MLRKILYYFIAWRILLQIILLLSISILPLQLNFLGGGLTEYLKKPYLWAWANFDGEHYISLARDGYKALTYFYFPYYPDSIRAFARLYENTFYNYLISGILISHVSLILGLIGFYKLITIDYKEKIANDVLILLLLFPTSFFFAGVFTESLFFALIVWSFYYARKKNWILAGILGALSTATRITGLALFPALIVESLIHGKKLNISQIIGILLTPLGMIFYMIFLKIETGDYLAFFHNLETVYGPQRSSHLVLFPQVMFRYIYRIIPNLNYDYTPIVFTTFLELGSAILFALILFIGLTAGWTKFKDYKLRLSYSTYFLFGYLIPTFSGSFSSFPRYVLILFPAYILAGVFMNKINYVYKIIIYLLLVLGLSVSSSLFFRGYWLS